MDFLHMKTIVFSQVMTDFVCFVVMAFLWIRDRKRFAGLSFWVADYVLQVAAVVLVALRGSVQDILSVGLAVPLALAGAWAMLMGLERFVGKRSSQVPNAVLWGLLVLLHLHFAFGQPDLAARNVNLSLGILIFLLQCTWLLLHRVDRGLRRITLGAGLVFGAYGLVSIVRVILTLSAWQAGNDLFRSGSVDAAMVLTYQMLLIMQTASLILMVNRRLLQEVTSQEERYARAFHSAPYALTLTRLSDGRIFQVNDGFENMTGYSHPEVIGRTTIELSLWAREEDRQAVVRQLSESQRVDGAEFPFRTKSGKVITGLFSADILVIDDQPCVLSSISDITERKRVENEREELIQKLQDALGKVKLLSGMIPICASCKKIRDDTGYWNHVEAYIRRHSEAEFSHGICPDCARKLYPDFAEAMEGKKPDGVKGSESGKGG
jgi:PAS domain S-box-containing protein